MLIDNRFAIICLGILIGCATNINMIGAQSFLLSQMPAIYTIYLVVFFNLIFPSLLDLLSPKKLKFAVFSLLAILVYILVLISLNSSLFSNIIRGLIWYFTALFGIRFFSWALVETTVRHLDPIRAQSYFSFLVTADEIGTLFAVLGLKFFGKHLDPTHTLYLIESVFVLAGIFVAFQFIPKQNFEITFTKKILDPPKIEPRLFQALLLSFIFMSLFLSVFRNTEDYLIKTVLKDHLVSFEAIRNMMTNYMLIASSCIIPLSLLMGRFIQRKHISPTTLLTFHTLSMLALGIVFLFIQPFYFFILFEIARRIEQNTFYSTANQMIFGSFVANMKSKLKSVHSFYYNTMGGAIVVCIFSYTQTWKAQNQRDFLIGLILLSLAIAFIFIQILKRYMSSILNALVLSNHKTAAIVAIQALSFLRPKNYETQMNELLNLSPKKLLRKTIIVGLGYTGSHSSVDTVIKEFASDKEEIQIAVLEALQAAQNYKANQFLLNILTEREKPKSFRVRINATAIIAALYQKKAIPFLLNGLEDSDPRVVANTLETLSHYKDKMLIPYFEKFSHSAIPRIRANALMGLGSFKKTHELYQKEVSSLLTGNDFKMTASILYVVGKLKNTDFKEEVIALLYSPQKDNSLIQGTLTWALTRIYGEKYFDLIGNLLGVAYQEKMQAPFLHFFSQFSKGKRFDIIKYLALKNHQNVTFIKNLGDHLRYSIFDFHEEIEYLHLIVDELKT